MSYDLPDRIAAVRRADGAFNVLEDELLAEKASSLGHHGRLVEKAMAALRAFDAAPGDPDERMRLLRKAARGVGVLRATRALRLPRPEGGHPAIWHPG